MYRISLNRGLGFYFLQYSLILSLYTGPAFINACEHAIANAQACLCPPNHRSMAMAASQVAVSIASGVYVKESVVRGHHKMRYSFFSCSSVPCISLLLLERTRGSRRGWVCVHMSGITPARPQFETRPLLLDVIEVLQPLNKTGLYSKEASIQGNMIHKYMYYKL